LLCVLFTFMLLGFVPFATSLTTNYGDITLVSNGSVDADHFPDIWDLTKGDLIISFIYDANGLIDDNNTHAWAQLGIRTVGYGDFNPTYGSEGAGVWFSSDYDYTPRTFDPDPPNASIQDLDDKIILQKAGGHDESDYNLPSVPPEPQKNHRIWFDRDGVDQWQAQNPHMVDGGTYNTNGIYRIVIRLHAINATTGTAHMTINGLDQGFETDNNWSTMELSPAGMIFTGNMSQMQVFYGLYGYGATHSVSFENITVTQVDMVGPEIIDVFAFPEWPNCNYGTVENPIRVVAVIIDESGVHHAKFHWKFNGSEDYSQPYFMQPLGGYENNSWQTLLTIPPQYIADGVVVKYKIFAMDNLNNSAQMEDYEPLFVYDCLPPETTKSYSEPNIYDEENDIHYITYETKINLTCSDTASGCNQTFYRLKNESGYVIKNWTIYSDPFTFPNITEGLYTIEYYSVDNAENQEGIKSQDVILIHAIPEVPTFSTTAFIWNISYAEKAGWNLIGVPCNISLDNLIIGNGSENQTYVGAVSKGWLQAIMYTYERGNGYKTVCPAELNLSCDYNILESQKAYWLLTLVDNISIALMGSCEFEEIKNMVIFSYSSFSWGTGFVGEQGWNLVGVMNETEFDNIMVSNGSENKSFVDAVESGWVQHILFTYDSGEGYKTVCSPEFKNLSNLTCDYDALEPWRAYWLLTLEDNLTFFISSPVEESSVINATVTPGGGGGPAGGRFYLFPACTPEWECTEWSACIDGIQTRVCIDKNDCGTNTGKPVEEMTCKVQMASEGTEKNETSEVKAQAENAGTTGITGLVAGALKEPASILIILIILIVILYFVWKFLIKKK